MTETCETSLSTTSLDALTMNERIISASWKGEKLTFVNREKVLEKVSLSFEYNFLI